MPYFNSNGLKIYYETEGEGPPVILIHGFASNLEKNWKQTNWVKVLKDNYHIILLDCRGHGKSDKPHDNSYYGYEKMIGDILKLMDELSIKKANFFGYSMGAYMTFQLLLQKSELFISAILGGFVLYIPQNEKERDLYREGNLSRIQAFKVENIDQIKDPISRRFRQFAELGGNDLDALAAVMAVTFNETPKWAGSPDEVKKLLKKVKLPVLTVVGSNELIPGDKTLIAQLIPNACHFQIQGKDHLTVVPDPKFHMVVKAFLNYVNKK